MESSTVRFLKGRKVAGLDSPVKSVEVRGDRRTIITETGERRTVSKQVLTNMLHKAIGAQQLASALRSIRERPDGTAAITLGGAERGERKTYVSAAAARQAAHRYHKQ